MTTPTTSTMSALLDYLATHGKDEPDAGARFQLFGVYLDASAWLHAQGMTLDVFQAVLGPTGLKAYARDVLRTIHAGKGVLLLRGGRTLIERVERLAGVDVHGNADTRAYTVFHTSGAQATGDRRALLEATGLTHNRLKDLLSGRRRLVKDWALTLAEARRGRLPPGRPKKGTVGLELVDAEGVALF